MKAWRSSPESGARESVPVAGLSVAEGGGRVAATPWSPVAASCMPSGTGRHKGGPYKPSLEIVHDAVGATLAVARLDTLHAIGNGPPQQTALAAEKLGDRQDLRFSTTSAAFVLRYRVGERYHSDVSLPDRIRAVRLLRRCAADFGIAENRLGMLGFSSGGYLAVAVGTRRDAGDADERIRSSACAADPTSRCPCTRSPELIT